MSLQGSILLVGEGNFSFSASLSQQHNEAASGSVIATCLQSEEEALRQEGAAENIQIITDSGTSLWLLHVNRSVPVFGSARYAHIQCLSGRISHLGQGKWRTSGCHQSFYSASSDTWDWDKAELSGSVSDVFTYSVLHSDLWKCFFIACLIRWSGVVWSGLYKAGRMCFSSGLLVWPRGLQLPSLWKKEWR